MVKNLRMFFLTKYHKKGFSEPFDVAQLDPKNFYFTIVTKGGGISAQIDAIRLGLSRSIVKLDPEKKTLLRKAGLMTSGSKNG